MDCSMQLFTYETAARTVTRDRLAAVADTGLLRSQQRALQPDLAPDKISILCFDPNTTI